MVVGGTETHTKDKQVVFNFSDRVYFNLSTRMLAQVVGEQKMEAEEKEPEHE